MKKNKIGQTAESVTPKHPDKMCDRISDAILDIYLEKDPGSRVAIEVVGGHDKVYITGEVSSRAVIGKEEVKDAVIRIVNPEEPIEIEANVSEQSHEIARGVFGGGAGDQGIMVGYACNENEAALPSEYYHAKRLCQYLYERWPVDGKTQVTTDGEGNPKKILASFCGVDGAELKNYIREYLEEDVEIMTNPAGDWGKGGFEADAGLTGRKIVADSYGPRVQVGGGAFSGKDPSKVDRSGALMARHLAKKLLKTLVVDEVKVYLSYAIGKKMPQSAVAYIRTGEEVKSMPIRPESVKPDSIIRKFKLRKPIYEELAEWGPFGNPVSYPWEKA